MSGRPGGVHVLAVYAAALPTASIPDVALAEPQIEILRDGSELVVIHDASAETVSFRYLVHSGGSSDPDNLDGLAHLLEHVVVHGSYEIDGRRLMRAARGLGANLNAFTGADYTRYVLDGPRDVMPELVRMYLKAITNPLLASHRVGVELQVISAEGMFRGSEGLYGLIRRVLVPSLRTDGSVIGSERSRGRIKREDLTAFYARHYRPTNTTVIFTGAIDAQAARQIVESSSLLAPQEERGPPLPVTSELGTPFETQILSTEFLTFFGYALEGVDDRACTVLSQLVEYRLNVTLTREQPLSSDVAATCLRMADHSLVIAVASSRSYSGSVIPDLMSEVFEETKQRPIDPSERRVIEKRMKLEHERILREPALLADAVADRLAPSKPGTDRGAALRAVLDLPRLDASEMSKVARASFVDSRRILVRAGPF
jgi:zinc protease